MFRIRVMISVLALLACNIEAFAPMVPVSRTAGQVFFSGRRKEALRMDFWQNGAGTNTLSRPVPRPGTTSLSRPVPLLASKDELQEIIRKAGSEGQGVLVLFKMQQCRKCSVLAPKFERLARDYGDRNTVWVMVNADKMDKAHRAEYNLKIVPAVQYFSKSGERLVEYIAVSVISQVLVDVGAMVEKHSEVRQTGRSSDLIFEEGAEPRPLSMSQSAPVSATRLIRSDLRAGVRKSTSKIVLKGA